VPAASPQPPPDPISPGRSGERLPPKADIYSLEAGGILIIGTVMLIFIVIRYWHHIAWGAR